MSVLLLCVVDVVQAVTQLHDVVYIVCVLSSTIRTFNATTHQRLTDIIIEDLSEPQDIAACEQTSVMYVSDWKCVWRVSSDGEDLKLWLPKSPSDTFQPYTLSVTSCQLLVTLRDTNQLMQFDETGKERRRVRVPIYMEPCHAVQSPTGTFIVSHKNTLQKQFQVSEINTEGQVLRQFSGSLLGLTEHIAVDSQGNIFVADCHNRHILLLDAQLALRRVIVDKLQLNYDRPWRLCYKEQSGQLMVGLSDRATMFDLLHC